MWHVLRSKFIALAAAVVASGFVASSAQAVIFSEATAGIDLNGGNTLTLFTLDPGFNQIAGTISFYSPGPNQFLVDWDSFAFIVPEGYQVSSGYLLGQNSNFSNPNYTAGWQLITGIEPFGSGLIATTTLVFGTTTYNSIPLSGLPILPGQYNFTQVQLSFGLNETASYEFGLTLTEIPDPSAAVPEPAALSVLAIGSALMLRRRTR